MGYRDKVAIKVLKKSFLKNKREFFKDKDTGSKLIFQFINFKLNIVIEMIYKNAL